MFNDSDDGGVRLADMTRGGCGLWGGMQRMGTVYGDWGAMSDMEKCPVVRVMHNDLAQPPSEDRPG